MTKAKNDPKVDNVEQSKQDGTVTTDEGKVVDARTGVAAEKPENEDHGALSYEEVEGLLGDLEPGDEGWVPLDEKGFIIGPAKKGKAPIGTLSASVYCPPDSRIPPLTTPAGALLSKKMNPDTQKPEHANTLQGDESEKG
jgi:hypothetical protein